jgi:hypothetical protein
MRYVSSVGEKVEGGQVCRRDGRRQSGPRDCRSHVKWRLPPQGSGGPAVEGASDDGPTLATIGATQQHSNANSQCTRRTPLPSSFLTPAFCFYLIYPLSASHLDLSICAIMSTAARRRLMRDFKVRSYCPPWKRRSELTRLPTMSAILS